MKWNLYFRLRGPGGEVEAPNSTNPVEAADLESVLRVLCDNLPRLGFGVVLDGVRIERHREPGEAESN